MMGKPDQISSIFWLILGLAVVYGSHRLGLGTPTHPGPGFLSFWCGVILGGLSLWVFFQGRLTQRAGRGKALRQLWAEMRCRKGIYVVLALLTYTFTFTYLGFLLSTALLLTFLFKAIEPEKWLVAVGGAFLSSLISFVIFALWLDVQLPRGILEKIFF
jgi:ABC-type polysaccharide/polyol phosphate export permease